MPESYRCNIVDSVLVSSEEARDEKEQKDEIGYDHAKHEAHEVEGGSFDVNDLKNK